MRHDLLPHEREGLLSAQRLPCRPAPSANGWKALARSLLSLAIAAVLLVFLVALFFASQPGATP